MVLTHAERVDADLIGENRLVKHVAENLRLGQQRAVRRRRDVAERIQAELESV
jgi:hypothetical protein